MARILLADDHDLVRETLAVYLMQNGLHDVHPVADLTAAERALAEGAFDLVLLDYRMPGMEALDGLRRLAEQHADMPVALISGAAGSEVARQAVDLGAAGFLPKTLAPDELIAAVDAMLRGAVYLPEATTLDAAHRLTPRELEVVRGIAGGKSNKEIARDLNVQEVTIKLHVKTLSRKLDARNRTHAAMRARDLGLV